MSEEGKDKEIEWARLELDREQNRAIVRLQEEELAIKRSECAQGESDIQLRQEEIAIKRRESEKYSFRSPLFLGILAATISLLGNIVATIYNGTVEQNKLAAQREIEDRRAQASLILEAVKTGNPDAAAKNLEFLLDASLIEDEDGTLNAYLLRRDPGTGIFLPLSSDRERSYKEPPPTKDARIEAFASRARCEAIRRTEPALYRAPGTELRVATWNIEMLGGKGEKDLDWLGCSIAWMNADVVALQELAGDRGDSKAAIQSLAQLVTKYGGEEWTFVQQECHHRQMLGFLVNTSRYSVLSSKDVWYLNSKAENESEACRGLRPGLVVRVIPKDSKSGQPAAISFVNVHADAGRERSDYLSRKKMRENLLRLASEKEFVGDKDQLIVLGDFNSVGTEHVQAADEIYEFAEVFNRISAKLVTDSGTCSYIYRDQCTAIDHIAVDKTLASTVSTPTVSLGYCSIVKRFGIDATELASRNILSDHCPILVDLRTSSIHGGNGG